MYGLAIYVKDGLPFVLELFLENSADSYLRFWLALLYSVSYFFFLYWSPSLSLYTVVDSISPNIDEDLSINPSANAFVFGDFNVHHKGWLTYSGGNDRPGELLVTLLRWLTFLLRFLTVTLTVLVFWICFFLLMLVFVLKWLSLHWEIQFPLAFCQTQNRMPYFTA